VALIEHLRDAVRNRRLELWLRPIYAPQNAQVPAMEAHIKWPQPGHSVAFQDVALLTKHMGLQGTIVDWGLRAACSFLGRWKLRSNILAPLTFAIPYAHLAAKTFPERVLYLTALFNVDPANLRFEIPSEEYIDGPTTAIKNAQYLRKCGIRFAMNGVRGLAYGHALLRRFDPEIVKIDSEPVRRLRLRGNDRELRQAREFAQSLGMGIAAGGLWDRTVVSRFIELGFDELQGPAIGADISVRSLDAMLAAGLL
jgi:diguanylate cyclase